MSRVRWMYCVYAIGSGIVDARDIGWQILEISATRATCGLLALSTPDQPPAPPACAMILHDTYPRPRAIDIYMAIK